MKASFILRSDWSRISSVTWVWRRLLSVLAFVAASNAFASDKVTIATNWVAQPELGGFYQALADGTYEMHGLDVTIKAGGPMINNRPLLAFGRIEFLIATNLLQPFDAAKQRIPTRAIAAFFQKDPQCILAHQGAGYDSWDDLKRAPLIMGNLGRQSFFRWMNAAHDFPKANLRPYNHSLTPFLTDRTAIMQGFATAEPKRIEEAIGEKPGVFLLADYGWTSYSTLLETRVDLIQSRPDLVQRFVDASIRGWYRYLYESPEGRAPADALIMKDNRAMTPEQIAFSIDKMRTSGLVDAGDAERFGIGAMQLPRVRQFHQLMVEAGMYKQGDLDPADAVTLKFVNKKIGVELRPTTKQ